LHGKGEKMKVIAYKKKTNVCIESTISEGTYIKKVLTVEEAEALLRELKTVILSFKKDK